MEILTKIIINYWIVAAIIMSFFWGIRSGFLFTPDKSGRYPRIRRFFICSYQFIFNFVGSMAGWCCFYALTVRVQSRLPDLRGFNFGDVLLFIFALLGLTGHLPQVISGFVASFGKLAEAAMKKISNMSK